MSVRYSVTVPDLVGRIIDRQAAYEGSKPTSVASDFLSAYVKQGIDEGKYPADWLVENNRGSEEIDASSFDAIATVLRKKASNQPLTSREYERAEHALSLPTGALQKVLE